MAAMALPKVLLANDDGLFAPGLAALVAAFAQDHEVYVVAPDQERSGVGHAFTLFNPLRADPRPGRFPDLAREVYSCSGMPADCVKLALRQLFRDLDFSLVVTGVNKGANMGSDVFYSGTVGAAREGLLGGVPAMAVSLVLRGPGLTGDRPHFSTAADWAARLAGELRPELERGAREGYFLNLNVANIGADEVKGWRWSDIADTRYTDGYVVHKDATGRPHYWLEGDLDLRDERPDCDVRVVRAGEVSVTPVSIQVGAADVLARVRGGSS